jgi:hypothetical protein
MRHGSYWTRAQVAHANQLGERARTVIFASWRPCPVWLGHGRAVECSGGLARVSGHRDPRGLGENRVKIPGAAQLADAASEPPRLNFFWRSTQERGLGPLARLDDAPECNALTAVKACCAFRDTTPQAIGGVKPASANSLRLHRSRGNPGSTVLNSNHQARRSPSYSHIMTGARRDSVKGSATFVVQSREVMDE